MKTTEELFEEFKDKRFIFYGSYARDCYLDTESYTGLVFEREEFYTILERAPELLPCTEEYFHKLDVKHSQTEGEEFIKEFDSLVDYYLWYKKIDAPELDFVHEYMFSNYVEHQEELAQEYDFELDEEEMSYRFNRLVRTANVLHSLDDWQRESVLDYIDKNYEVKTVTMLIKKGVD